MIRPLRQKHRIIACTLGIVLPAAFAAGLAARRPLPVVMAVAPEVAPGIAAFGKVVWTRADVWPDEKIITHLRRDASGAVAVEFIFRDLARPDVLLYWAPGKASTGQGLPETARFLGVLAMRRPLLIPDEVRGETGHFVFYSLAEHEVVARSNALIVQKN